MSDAGSDADEGIKSVGVVNDRRIVLEVLPTKSAMLPPYPFAEVVRVVASAEMATLCFLQRPLDEEADIRAAIVEAVRAAPPGDTPIRVTRRVEPVAKVMIPIAALRDLRRVLDKILRAVDKGLATEDLVIPVGQPRGEGE